MLNEFSRTQMLIGRESMEILNHSTIAVFGIGGVGSFAAEALARSGVGKLVLFDNDTVCLSNINRQLIATHKTVGQKKVDVMKQRILDINPKCVVETHECFYAEDNADEFDLNRYSYIVDAIDTVSSKLVLIEKAAQAKVPVISCMGAGNKLDPTRFEVSDIYKTSVCPLAKIMRKELKSRGIASLKVVYSKEEPIKLKEKNDNTHYICPQDGRKNCSGKKQAPGSISFVPSVAGLILASEVIKDLIKYNNN